MSESKQPLSDFDGLPSSKPIDVQELAAEEKWLDEQASRPAYKRAFAFLRKGGPGYLQSALTLGGGTAATMLFAGAAFGYGLLWVAPVSMVLGIIMMSAIAHQTLSTGLRPYAAMPLCRPGIRLWFCWRRGAVVYHLALCAVQSLRSSNCRHG